MKKIDTIYYTPGLLSFFCIKLWQEAMSYYTEVSNLLGDRRSIWSAVVKLRKDLWSVSLPAKPFVLLIWAIKN